MNLKKLPIGLSSLDNILNDGYIYIDKTRFVAKLVNSGKYYFFSRPRRFGKTLFLDTLKQAFLGNKELFNGLDLENQWDWSSQYPVIHISFAGEVHDVKLLSQRMHNILDEIIRDYALHELLAEELLSTKLSLLIKTLAAKFQQKVVILIDEYDKPMLDNIENLENAGYARDLLKSLYSVIKDYDALLKFVFLTGVTKFAKAGVFSSLNNLNDITFSHEYADCCGYTQHDIASSFKDYLVGVDLVELKRWYNGYNFLGTAAQKVYNPFDILLFISNGKRYSNYWFETGTPTFLIKLLQKNCYYLPDLEGMQISSAEFGSFDIDNLTLEILLLQAGYLTLSGAQVSSITNLTTYTLDYPNFEVRQSLNDSILSRLFNGSPRPALKSKYRLEAALQQNNLDQLQDIFSSLLANIPHDWYRNNPIQRYEGFYCSLVYTFFNAVGVYAIPEDNTCLGQIDLTVQLPDKILIFEFKMLSSANAANALQQIKDKRYHEKYLNQHKPLFLCGMVFDEARRNICEFAWEAVVLACPETVTP